MMDNIGGRITQLSLLLCTIMCFGASTFFVYRAVISITQDKPALNLIAASLLAGCFAALATAFAQVFREHP